MNPIETTVSKKLADLGVSDAERLAPLFAEVRARFDAELASAARCV